MAEPSTPSGVSDFAGDPTFPVSGPLSDWTSKSEKGCAEPKSLASWLQTIAN